MVGRIVVFLSGLGLFVINLGNYVPGIPAPFDFKGVQICEIGTAVISPDMVLMGSGSLIILLAMVVGK